MAKRKVKKKTTTKRKKRTVKQRRALRNTILKLFFFLVITLTVYLAYCFFTLPNMEQAIYRDRQPATTILADNGNEIETFGSVYSEVIYLKDLPPYVKDAIIATEDRRFYSHFGFDFISFTRAMVRNIFAGRYAQGGSTITQQVAKNLFLTPKKNIKRKTQELLLAFWLEYKFSKDQILTLYINRVYLGSGTYGIEAASNKYFQKSSRDLNLMEAAIIAGMLKGPSKYNPIASKKRAISRATVVLDNMVKNKYVGQEEANFALKMNIGNEKNYRVDGARHFADWVYNETNEFIGERDSDIYVLSSLDQNIQQKTEKVLIDTINKNKAKKVSEGAVVVMGMDGSIKALVGGVNYNKSQFNRATQALRQPGSSFKPIVYLTAIQNGYKVLDKIEDTPLSINKWKPENYDKQHYGEVTLLHALTKSLNLATVDLAEKVGREKIARNAEKMGITTQIKNIPSMSLGSFEVRLIDMARVYTVIANGGYPVYPYAIQEIYSKDGYQLYNRQASDKNRIFTEDEIQKIKEMLANVINNGTGKKAKISQAAYGKTGTTQDYRDAWFVGFTDKYVCAVWVGNDNNSSMKGVTGGGLPAEIWKNIMEGI